MPINRKVTKVEMLAAVKLDGMLLRFAPTELQDEREFVFEAVKQNGRALEYASTILRADREIVFEAVKQSGWALEFASTILRADREIVLEAVMREGQALIFASTELRAEREIVFEAVKQNGRALEFASTELRADREIVLEAVKQNPLPLRCAPKELREDREIIKAATMTLLSLNCEFKVYPCFTLMLHRLIANELLDILKHSKERTSLTLLEPCLNMDHPIRQVLGSEHHAYKELSRHVSEIKSDRINFFSVALKSNSILFSKLPSDVLGHALGMMHPSVNGKAVRNKLEECSGEFSLFTYP